MEDIDLLRARVLRCQLASLLWLSGPTGRAWGNENRPYRKESMDRHHADGAKARSLTVSLALVAGCSTGCFEEYAYQVEVHAVGELRDVSGRPVVGAEARLIKYWPVDGRSVVEPPLEVLFSSNPSAPPGAAYGVEMVASARTDASGWFEMHLSPEAVADPRYDLESSDRIITARTIILMPPTTDRAGVYGYTFRYGGRYTHHCELFDLPGRSAQFLRVDEGWVAEVDVAEYRREVPVSDLSFEHRVRIRGLNQVFEVGCTQAPGGGCAASPSDPTRLRIPLAGEELAATLRPGDGPFFAETVTWGPLHRVFDPMAPPASDPTLDGALPAPGLLPPTDPANPAGPTLPPEAPGGDPGNPGTPGGGPDNPGSPPGEPVAPSEPVLLPVRGAWAVGPKALEDLTGTAATDGDPITRHTLDTSRGDFDAVYVLLGDVRLVEAGLLNAFVDNADLGCLVVETTPSVYRRIETATSAPDWSGMGRFCGSAGTPGEMSAVQRFRTTDVDGKRAGWVRIRVVSGDPLRILEVGEVTASGFPF